MNLFGRLTRSILTILLSASAGYLLAQQSPGGIHSTEITKADLGIHFECMEGKSLRMTRHEIDPGKGGSEHSHLGRPEVFYVIDGSVVEHQGENSQIYTAGQGFVSNSDMSVPHRVENASEAMSTVLDIQIVTENSAPAPD